MAQTKVLLLACGSYNPPTNMHLRMFELARDHLQRLGTYDVIGGVISPVHDSYGKQDLVSGVHRCAMINLALEDNDWVQLSKWESHQSEWSRTRQVLQYHQNQLNSALNANLESPRKRQKREAAQIIERDEVDDMGHHPHRWAPDEIAKRTGDGPVQVMLLCGGDLLESFAKPGLWLDEDIEAVAGQHGLVVITREGTNPYKFIYESDILTKHMSNIIIVTEWITNDISSTKIRRAIRRGQSVKYLIPDAVSQYICQNQLYADPSASATTTPNHNNKYLHTSELSNKNSSVFLTPSPSDLIINSANANTHLKLVRMKPKGNISRMAEFLGAEFGTKSKERGSVVDHERALNEANAKKWTYGSSKLLPKSTSGDLLDGRKVSKRVRRKPRTRRKAPKP